MYTQYSQSFVSGGGPAARGSHHALHRLVGADSAGRPRRGGAPGGGRRGHEGPGGPRESGDGRAVAGENGHFFGGKTMGKPWENHGKMVVS